MATPSYATVINQINTFIVANGNNDITANVLNPILKIITGFANNHMGDLDNLTTDETDTLVDAINSLKQNINDIVGNSVQLHVGNANPNYEPPSTYNYGDFYMQLSPLDNEPIQLWQFNGFEWFAQYTATFAQSYAYTAPNNTFVTDRPITAILDIQIEHGCNFDSYATVANGNEVTIDDSIIFGGETIKIIYK